MSPHSGTSFDVMPHVGGRSGVFDDPTDAPRARSMALHRATFFGKADTLRVVDVTGGPQATAEELEWWMLDGEVVPVRTTPPPALTRQADARPVFDEELQNTPVLKMTPLPQVDSRRTPSAPTLTRGTPRRPVTRVPVHWTAAMTICFLVCGFVGLVWSLGAA